MSAAPDPQASSDAFSSSDASSSSSPSGSPERQRPHVVMLVANDVRADTRVRKSALAVAALGLRVTVVGITAGARRWDTVLGDPDEGGVRIVRVPVDFALSRTRKQRRSRWQHGEIPLLSPDRERESLARRRLAAAEVAAQAEPGLPGNVRRRAVRVRRVVL
ncbi:MAG TPA: hypothetical protein VHN80_16150, partial [Kineosporiaceae bacterium]|nr:hypothetical protein [Kineosporiaceae bacterium]